MTKKTSMDGTFKTIACHVEGFPKPAVQWTITNTGSIINTASIFLLFLHICIYISIYISVTVKDNN